MAVHYFIKKHRGEVNIIDRQFGSPEQHQNQLNQITLNILGMWLSGFCGGFSFCLLLWLWFWFGRV